MRYSSRTNYLKPEGAYKVLAKASEMEAAGRKIIHFEIGQPDFDTFLNISTKGVDAISTGKTRYTPSEGIPQLRAAIAIDYGRRNNQQIDPTEVVIGPGAKPALFFATMALIEPGDEVIYPDPGFPTYEAMIRLAGGKPIPVPLLEEQNFTFDLDKFDRLINTHTKLVILNSPNNPTGGVIPITDLEHIAEKALQFDFWIMSDEIYSRIAYDNLKVPSIISIPGMKPRTICIDGFSKTFSMTGWRLGYGIMPRNLAEKVSLLLTHSVGSTAEFTQYAGIEAITGPQEQVEERVNIYQISRDVLIAGLNSLPGVSCQTPAGAFYAFPNIKYTNYQSSQLANLILEEAGVALLPGSAFGKQGEGYLRLSFATSIANIKEGLSRLAIIFNNLRI
jgi:aspartate/methionine/tyrosine aminotransferase